MRIEKYGLRNWAVYDNNGDLVCVAVYKKGAMEVVRRLEGIDSSDITLKHNTADVKKLIKEIKTASSKIKQITKELNSQLES